MPESMWQNSERLGWEQLIEMTSEVQGNYPNLKQNLREKNLTSKKSAKASRCFANAVSGQQGSKSSQLGVE